MTNPNIPTQPQRYPIESPHSDLPRAYLKEFEIVDPIRTELSVLDMNWFRIFLDANDMGSFELGYYEDRGGVYPWTIDNKICYSNNEADDLIENNLIHMNLKYGGLLKAFLDFKEVVSRS